MSLNSIGNEEPKSLSLQLERSFKRTCDGTFPASREAARPYKGRPQELKTRASNAKHEAVLRHMELPSLDSLAVR